MQYCYRAGEQIALLECAIASYDVRPLATATANIDLQSGKPRCMTIYTTLPIVKGYSTDSSLGTATAKAHSCAHYATRLLP